MVGVGTVLVRCQVTKFPADIWKNPFLLTAVGALCAVPFTQKKEGLSRETLICRASSLVTDSTNTFLSQTTLALVESLAEYGQAIHTLLSLHKRYVSSASRLTPVEEDKVWEVIIGKQQEINDLKQKCQRFESNWMMAINLSELAAESAFNAGADQASVTARSCLMVAQSHVEQVRQLSLEAEENLKESKAMGCQRITLPAPSAEDEEDVPEAYLRED